MRIAVIGAGWAGLAAAVEATRAGHHVSLFEAARIVGGRARALPVDAGAMDRLNDASPKESSAPLDNGQHILIGAYTETLRLMREVGIEEAAVLRRLPLSLQFADGSGIALPRWPAPWDVLGGILGARGWSWRDKTSVLFEATRWKACGFACDPRMTVAELCSRITPRVMSELIEPLCVSALNTPVDEASAQVFLRVLKDALFAVKGGGDLLLPLTDLGALFPVPASEWLANRGAELHVRQRVASLQPADDLDETKTTTWLVDDQPYDRVVLACPPREATRLIATALPNDTTALQWCESAMALRHIPIATVYALATAGLPEPMLCLRSDRENGPAQPAQFVFDRAQLGGRQGLLAFVASASTTDRQWLQAAVVRQAQLQLGITVEPLHTVVEKRATFACTPGLIRPRMRVAKGLLACGDYIDGPYPATIEGAVRSGVAAALAINAVDAPA